MHMVILKGDGKKTSRMPQQVAKNYLKNIIHRNRYANLSQALNDAFGGKGKPTVDLRSPDSLPVLHASAGNKSKRTSVSLFYDQVKDVITLFAMGEHIDLIDGNVSYKLSDFGQGDGLFKKNATVTLKKTAEEKDEKEEKKIY